MKRIKIKDNYVYLYFSKQKSYFRRLEKFLNKGYEITDSIHLCVEVKKDDKKYFLSFIDVEVNENIKKTLKGLDISYKLVKPNYQVSMLNSLASIRNYFGQKSDYPLDANLEQYLDKKYQNIIVMLLDGMGENILENNLPKDSFLKSHHAYTNTAIYPSTTAASTTATKSGLSPRRTGWLGWENYFSEVNKNLILFSGIEYKTDKPTGFNTYKVLPYQPFFHDLNVIGKIIEPDFSKEFTFKETLNKSLDNLEKDKINVQYVYHTEPDGIMHKYGSYSEEAIKTLKAIDEDLKEYVNKLPENTLLIISADHGHTNVKPIDLYECNLINKMLKRPPSNDSRCITFCVKEEYKKIFPDIFKALFGYAYQLHSAYDLLNQGFFGLINEETNPKVNDFLADYVAVGVNEYYFNYKGKNNHNFKSHHAGITADEMFVPVIIYRK